MIFEDVEKLIQTPFQNIQSLSDDSKTAIEDFLRKVWVDEGDLTPEKLSQNLTDMTSFIKGLNKRLDTVSNDNSYQQLKDAVDNLPSSISIRNAIFLKIRIENQICISNQLPIFQNLLFTSFDAAMMAQYEDVESDDVSSENEMYAIQRLDELSNTDSKDSDLAILFALLAVISIEDLKERYPDTYSELIRFTNKNMFTLDKNALANSLSTVKDFKVGNNALSQVSELPETLKTSIKDIIVENYQQWLNTSSETYEDTIRRRMIEDMYQQVGIKDLLKDTDAIYDRMTIQRQSLYATRVNLAINEGIYSGFVYAGIHYCKFVAVLDARTSTMCKTMNGKVIAIKDILPGINAPPLHYHCRSTLVYISDAEAHASDPSLL